MGNCLKSPTSDDISLLHESSDRASYGDGTEIDQEPPPPYQVCLCLFLASFFVIWLSMHRDPGLLPVFKQIHCRISFNVYYFHYLHLVNGD